MATAVFFSLFIANFQNEFNPGTQPEFYWLINILNYRA